MGFCGWNQGWSAGVVFCGWFSEGHRMWVTFSSCPLRLLRLREDRGGWQTSASGSVSLATSRFPLRLLCQGAVHTAQCPRCTWLSTWTGCSCGTRPQSGVPGSLTSQEVPVPVPPPLPAHASRARECSRICGSGASGGVLSGFPCSCLFAAALCAPRMLQCLSFPERVSLCGPGWPRTPMLT